MVIVTLSNFAELNDTIFRNLCKQQLAFLSLNSCQLMWHLLILSFRFFLFLVLICGVSTVRQKSCHILQLVAYRGHIHLATRMYLDDDIPSIWIGIYNSPSKLPPQWWNRSLGLVVGFTKVFLHNIMPMSTVNKNISKIHKNDDQLWWLGGPIGPMVLLTAAPRMYETL